MSASLAITVLCLHAIPPLPSVIASRNAAPRIFLLLSI
jgi:hypothetical protein